MINNDAEMFVLGDIWETTRGARYRVVGITEAGQAVMRLWPSGERGRLVRKRVDGVGVWRLVSREDCAPRLDMTPKI
jgi:hypothetical protein